MLNIFAMRNVAKKSAATATNTPRPESLRRHVLNRMMQEKSGRLYCNEEFDFEIPALDIYDAR